MNDMVVIIDYEMGNVSSIKNMLKKMGVACKISRDADDIDKATKLVLPGVGSFDKGMESLEKLGLVRLLDKAVLEDKKPILGICLGMQMLCLSSEEGQKNGLGYIPLKVKKFIIPINSSFKIPHMGWRNVLGEQNNPITQFNKEEFRFYFVHSFYVPLSTKYTILSSDYIVKFSAAIQDENVYGVQFNPEKSHKYGMKLLRNFIEVAV